MKRAKSIPGAPAFWRLGDTTAPAGPHVALLPGALAPMLPLDLPDKLRGMARERVAERQLVEQLATQAGGFEMRPYTAKGEKLFKRVLVADPDLARSWRKALRPGCSALLPDYFALPTAKGLWSIEVSEDSVRVRLGPDDGFTAEPGLAVGQLAELEPPKAVLRLGEAEPAVDAMVSALNVPVLTDVSALKKAGFSILRWPETTGGVDLKDPPSAIYDRLRRKILRWRTTAVFAVLAVAAWTGMMVLETQRMQADAARTQTLVTELVRKHFVPSGPILDVRAQVSAAVDAASAPIAPVANTLLPLDQLQIAAPIMTTEAIHVLTAAYRVDTGLVVSAEAADFAALDQVIEDLQNANFLVEQLDARAQQSGGVVARLRLELLQ